MTEPTYWGKPAECDATGRRTKWRVRKARGLTAVTVWSVFAPEGGLAADFDSFREALRSVTDPWTQMYQWMGEQ